MPGVLPDPPSGGLIIRDAAGNCTPQPNVLNAYCPPASFTSTCEITALPSDCTARITAAQINAIVSELMSFAACMNPTGNWDCASVNNLCNAFTAWLSTLNVSGITISDTPPAGAEHEDLWYESDTGNTYIYYDDGNSAQWVQIAPGAGAKTSSITISDIAPTAPVHEDLWFESDSGNTFIYYNDGNSSQWVQINTGGGGSSSGITDAPNDGQMYARKNLTWAPFVAAGGLPPGGLPGQVLMISAANTPAWNATIDGGTY